MGLMLVGCNIVPAAPEMAATPVPALTPTLSPEAQLIQAFAETDPIARREAVMQALGPFLWNLPVRSVDEQTATTRLSQVARTSENLILDSTAFVRREEYLTVVGVPDGLGLYLYNLTRPGASPVELSPWTVGLSSVDVAWGNSVIGVTYHTLGADGDTRAHFALAREMPSREWELAWLSDEEPLWWINAYNASVVVSQDFGTITICGEAPGTTSAFDEQGDVPRRVFLMRWRWVENQYAPWPSPESFSSRQEWEWEIAQPSAYATLIEFLERLRRGDDVGTGTLVASPDLISTAIALGLDRPERRYRAIYADQRMIVFRDAVGVTVAEFTLEDPRLLATLYPFGAEPREGE